MNIIAYIGIGFTILTTIVNVAVLLAMKFNDMKHLSDDIKDIKKEQGEIKIKIGELSERVSTLEGKLGNE